MENKFEKDICNKIYFVSRYVGSETVDWFTVKKEIFLAFNPKQRSLLSRRHKTSKKFFINDFEMKIIKFWEEITGIKLKINTLLLHSQNDERPPRHWALMELNKKRQMQADLKKRERETHGK